MGVPDAVEPVSGRWARVVLPRFRSAARPTGTQRVWLLTVAIALVATALGAAMLERGAVRALPFPFPWPLIALGFYAAETRVVHLHIGRSAHSFSMAELPLLFGVFFLDPVWFIAARLLGGGIALAISRRQRSVKLAFNLSQFALGAVTAVMVVQTIVPPGSAIGPLEWLAAYLATIGENLIAVTAIASAISLAEGRAQLRRIPEMLSTGLTISLANASLALLAMVVLHYEPPAAVLFTVPILVAFVAYRAYVTQRQQNEGLEMLYQSTRILQRTPQVDRAIGDLLAHARVMFRAQIAELSLLPAREGDDVLRTTSREEGDEELMRPAGPELGDPLLRTALEERRAILVTAADPAGTPRFRNALVAPLIGDHRVLGTMVVANRLSDISTFDTTDLRLFETLASHIAVSLENGQLEQSLSRLVELKDELHHQANHDPLTGLANRAMFSDAVTARLAASDLGDRVLAVVFLDLDDFKLVNDTMGHPAGDALLRSVAARISASVRDEDVAARLGGDEFAIVMWDREDLVGARRLADRLLGALDEPFVLGESVTSVHASIGVAAGVRNTATAEELLRNADVAMYVAKANGKGRVVLFESSMATAIATRTETATALRRAIAAEELVLHYQPVFDLVDQQVVGVEALVRWQHPKRGLVGPMEFIPLAEQSELILDLGRWVQQTALAQLTAWERLGPPFDRWWMSVNVSPRQLEHPAFVAETGRMLRASGVDPALVALELTESGLIPNADESSDKLHALRDLGVRLLIDDFGTGYSSLGYLQRFPVNALKIAREFVDVEGVRSGGWALAAAIIAMARTLGLEVIAEGVETPSQLERLRDLGCTQVQGFLLARPTPVTDIEARFRVPVAVARRRTRRPAGAAQPA
jgi:diguanylate cyclase (GGDEF)-like protein